MTTSPTTGTAEFAAPYTISRDLPVTPDEAFALITEPARLRRWKAVSATVDLRAGGGYRFTVIPGQVAAGSYREVEPGRRLVFGWGWEDNPGLPPDASTVTVTIEPTDAGCRVTLVHEGLTPEQAAGHAAGWEHFFGRLERLAADGDAGPDEWAAVPDPIDPVIAAEACLAALQPVLRGLTTADREKPTPCPDYNCHELAEHLMTSIVAVGSMAGAEVTRPETGGLEAKVSEMTGQAVDAWRSRGAGPDDLGPAILAVELLLHGWDLAQASGQRVPVSDEVVAYVSGLAERIVPNGRGTSFGDEVEPGPDADALGRLAAYAGRVPIA